MPHINKKGAAHAPHVIQSYKATHTCTTCPPSIQVNHTCTMCHTSKPSDPHVHKFKCPLSIQVTRASTTCHTSIPTEPHVLHVTRSSSSDPHVQPLTVRSPSDTHVQHVTTSALVMARAPRVPQAQQATHTITSCHTSIPSDRHVHHVSSNHTSDSYVHHVSHKHTKLTTRTPRDYKFTQCLSRD